jgi:hypothetical protein
MRTKKKPTFSGRSIAMDFWESTVIVEFAGASEEETNPPSFDLEAGRLDSPAAQADWLATGPFDRGRSVDCLEIDNGPFGT